MSNLTRRTAAFGRCERWLPIQERKCGKRGRYLLYGTRTLCKECQQRHRAGRETLFVVDHFPTPAERWAFWERLRADVGAIA
jgi:hypothetical protein